MQSKRSESEGIRPMPGHFHFRRNRNSALRRGIVRLAFASRQSSEVRIVDAAEVQ